ncbi:MAG: hypothetical protein RL033_5000 [Pseudomonadota bacterium]
MEPATPNPYQPPTSVESPLDDTRVAGDSASRMSRLGASLIDALLSLVIFVPLQYLAGVYHGFPKMTPTPFPQSLLWAIGGVVLWVLLHGSSLARSAQTIGKKALGIQVVNVSDGKPTPLTRLIFWRFVPTMLVAQLPYVGPLLGAVNVLLIFRGDRRCMHDHIAGTRVVNAVELAAER